jgi:CHASE3 domain sensor protein
MNPAAWKRLLNLLVLIPVLALAAVATVLGLGIWRLHESARSIDHADRVIAEANQLEKLFLDEETGVRGYLLTRDRSYLEPWTSSGTLVDDCFARLATLVATDAAQVELLADIRHDYQGWRTTAESDLQPSVSRPALLLHARQGKALMDGLRIKIGLFRLREESVRATRTLRNQSDFHRLLAATVLLAGGIGIALGFWLRHGVGIAADVYRDQLQRAEERQRELEEAQQRIRVTLTNSPVVLYTCDTHLRYTWMHRPFPATDLQSTLGRTDAELFDRESARALMDFKRAVLRSGIRGRKEIRVSLRGKPEVYDITAEPMRDSSGEITGLTVAALDLTQRSQADAEREALYRKLRESFQWIEIAQKATNAGFWQYWPQSGDTYLTDVAAQLLGFENHNPTFDEVLGRVHPEDRPRVTQAMAEAEKTGEYFAEFRVVRPDGEAR